MFIYQSIRLVRETLTLASGIDTLIMTMRFPEVGNVIALRRDTVRLPVTY